MKQQRIRKQYSLLKGQHWLIQGPRDQRRDPVRLLLLTQGHARLSQLPQGMHVFPRTLLASPMRRGLPHTKLPTSQVGFWRPQTPQRPAQAENQLWTFPNCLLVHPQGIPRHMLSPLEEYTSSTQRNPWSHHTALLDRSRHPLVPHPGESLKM